MRVVSSALTCAASFSLLAACSDEPRVAPLTAAWLEWSDSVAAGKPFGVRLYGMMDAESRHLRVRVTTRGDTVTIEPYSVDAPVRDQAFGYDTLVWVPGIAATAPRTITLRAPSPHLAVAAPWPLRTFGELTVSPTVPVGPLMHSVGIGEGFQTSLGCFLVIPLAPSRVYVSADQTPDWAPSFTGFVYGRIDPFLLSACLDDARVIQVDSIG